MNTSLRKSWTWDPRVTVAALGVVSCLPAGCPVASVREQNLPSRVFLVETSGLESPKYGVRPVFNPLDAFSLTSITGQSVTGVGFFVSIAADDPTDLRMRLIQPHQGTNQELKRSTGPASPDQRLKAARPQPFLAAQSEFLASGDGVFWLDEAPPEEGRSSRVQTLDDPARTAMTYRFAVLLPENRLTPRGILEVYADPGPSAVPVLGDRIELARDFFYMANLGDSVQWGNGLRDADKISSRVAEVIERETGRAVVMQRYAQSGAKIVPAPGDSICEFNCIGEVPTVSTSVTAQVDLIKYPERVELVLLDGCITDAGVDIFDPIAGNVDLPEQTRRFCGEAMAELLRKVRRVAPQARVAVTGYYQAVGPDSDLFGLQRWARSRGRDTDEAVATYIAAVTLQSELFVGESTVALRGAVDLVNAESGGPPMITFVDPEFGSNHGIFSPDPWLWGMSDDDRGLLGGIAGDLGLELLVFPEDPLAGYRLQACFGPHAIQDLVFCLYFSVGHPNPTGAAVYAEHVIERLRDLGLLNREPGGELASPVG